MKFLGAIDFRDCQDDMAVLRKFWHVLWPHFSGTIATNEVLLEEQKKTLVTYANLVEDFKLLEIAHEKLKEETSPRKEFQSKSQEGVR